MPKPNFFIVGAPKSGTTAMYTYLQSHPDIFMPAVKEPYFFCPDIAIAAAITDYEAYMALFEDATHEKRIGEASVWYLYSKIAAAHIYEFNPVAKIIIMLRNPADMLYSLYTQFRYNRFEDQPTFEDALAAEADRKSGKRLPAGRAAYERLFYHDVAKYAGQVARYLDYFTGQQVHVILYDDFRADTAKVYRDTLTFLEVDPDFEVEFKIVNAAKQVYNEALHRLLVAPPALLQDIVHVFPSTRRVSRWIGRHNRKTENKRPMNLETRRQLQNTFRPEVRRLSELLGRDLTHWCC